jgi:very-short-patch-repair endonuclease
LPADEVTVREGIPVTTTPRTLLDLASVLTRQQLERAFEEAEVRRPSGPALDRRSPCSPSKVPRGNVAARSPRRRAGRLDVTRSKLEDQFLAFLDRHGLPRPQVNAGIEVRGRWMECDCVWRSHRLIVELDSRGFHGTTAAFERDRARDRVLQAAGWRVVRVTWRQLHDDGGGVAADLRELRRYPPRVY